MATAPHSLTTAIGSYPYTRPLMDGNVTSPRIQLDHKEVVPANRAFRPMVKQQAYDVSELAPEGRTLAGMLRDGKIDAAAGLEPADHPDLRTFFPNPPDIDDNWLNQTGVAPINHTLYITPHTVTPEELDATE